MPALTMLNQITKQYGGLIADTLAYGGSTGVDLTREARYVRRRGVVMVGLKSAARRGSI